MRVLPVVRPTPEQLKIILRQQPGTILIRGAAGSGKTTTILLRLRSLAKSWLNRRERLGLADPVRILVLTFNRTLRGYINELASEQVKDSTGLDLQIYTFAKWAVNLLGHPLIANHEECRKKIQELGTSISLTPNFLIDEVEYMLGRFLPEDLDNYLTCRRDGRGVAPRVDQKMRQQILKDVILPYNSWKVGRDEMDWNDLAIELTKKNITPGYDIIIVDEAQDFSANQIRAIGNQLTEDHSLTFVLDAVQRIYPRGFTWKEAAINIKPNDIYRLKKNYRNTVEIARFALPLLKGMDIDDDGTLPDFNSCERKGPVPKVVKGKFGKQMEYVMDYIRNEVDLSQESVAFLLPKGGGWFSEIEKYLQRSRLKYLHITRESDWPEGDENIALCTLHSAKGLEFNHVIIPGLNQEVTIHGKEEGDDQLNMLRRLLAMGIGRARQSVVLGYKPEEASTLISYLNPDSYEEVDLCPLTKL